MCGTRDHYARDCWHKRVEVNVVTTSQSKIETEDEWDFQVSCATIELGDNDKFTKLEEPTEFSSAESQEEIALTVTESVKGSMWWLLTAMKGAIAVEDKDMKNMLVCCSMPKEICPAILLQFGWLVRVEMSSSVALYGAITYVYENWD
ncbi:hypothetical protein GH714_012485 [Hevea brasiliensis]|uniref:Uncharacterized protein n=1 Tax=Hevea brasiliensis TaxID=3981 RepID=A0A6A6LTR4_HEVBR|nr:hypothetical protein GH714_012485 [Hevea brasiliensis]